MCEIACHPNSQQPKDTCAWLQVWNNQKKYKMIVERVQALALGGMIQITKGKQRTSEMPTLKKINLHTQKTEFNQKFSIRKYKEINKTSI